MLWIITWLGLSGLLCLVSDVPATAAVVILGICVGAVWLGVRLEKRQRAAHEKRMASLPDMASADAMPELTKDAAADVSQKITIDTSRPIIERVAFWNRHPMDGVRLRIAYVDAYGDRTERTIRCTELQYGQNRFEITPDRIHAHCELRDAERTFMVHQIEHFWEAQGRKGRGREITDITPFLIEHTAIPRGDDPYHTNPFMDDFLLDGSQVTLFYSQRNRPEDGQVILGLYCMTVITDNDGKRVYSVSGKNMKTGANRTIRGERITNACDPETGDVIEDILAFFMAHRKE